MRRVHCCMGWGCLVAGQPVSLSLSNVIDYVSSRRVDMASCS